MPSRSAAGTPHEKRLSTLVSRDDITVEQLHELKQKFADGNLNEEEFVELFLTNIDPNLSQEELIELFQKIDVNCDGTVDWDEFTNFMFLSGNKDLQLENNDTGDVFSTIPTMSQSDHTRGSKNLQSVSLSRVSSSHRSHADYHKEAITSIRYNSRNNQYITGAKDGTIKFWSANNLSYISTLTTRRDWVSDCTIMYKSNVLAVCSMERSIAFYDLATSQLLGETTSHSKDQPVPLCIDYIDSLIGDGKEAITIGDDGGGITLLKCSNYWGQNDVCNIETNAFSSKARAKKHKDWITKVRWVNEIGGIVSASLDSNIIVTDIERMTEKFQYSRHTKEVHDVAWSSGTRLMASCGLDRTVCLWNPFSSEHAVAVLKGHNAGVFHLCCDDANSRLISLSSDNIFKVWDLRNFRCIQTFEDNYKETGGSDHKLSTAIYDNRNHVLISATNRLSRWQLRNEGRSQDSYDIADRQKDEERSTQLIAYNNVFNQIVTADMSSEGIIHTWNVSTGEEICSFSNAHNGNQITAITFDTAGRRLITGAHDGKCLKVWNFSNGAQVKTFEKRFDNENTDESYDRENSPREGPHMKKRGRQEESEISCIVYVERHLRAGTKGYFGQRLVCCVGWDRRIYIWSDSSDDDVVSPEYSLPRCHDAGNSEVSKRQYHADDILTATYVSPDWIVTGGSDGKVIVWNLRTSECIPVCECSVPVETVVYCQKIGVLFVVGDGRNVHCINSSFHLAATISLNYPRKESISSLACDSIGSTLVSGDLCGTISVWDIIFNQDGKSINISPCISWSCGNIRIMKITFAENSRNKKDCLVISGSDGSVSLWSVYGRQIGIFGRNRLWNIENELTFMPQVAIECASEIVRISTKRKFVFISGVPTDEQGSMECLPHSGEVWVNVSEASIYKWMALQGDQQCHNADEPETNHKEKLKPMQRALYALAEEPTEFVEIICVIKVGRENIEAWNGMQASPTKTVISVEEFIKDIGWIRQKTLSRYIGRYFRGANEEEFRVESVSLKPKIVSNSNPYTLMDTEGRTHEFVPLSSSLPLLSRNKARSILQKFDERNQKKSDDVCKKKTQNQTAEAAYQKLKASFSGKEDDGRPTAIVEPQREKYRTLSSMLPPVQSLNERQKVPCANRASRKLRLDSEMDNRRTYEPQDIAKFKEAITEHQNHRKKFQD